MEPRSVECPRVVISVPDEKEVLDAIYEALLEEQKNNFSNITCLILSGKWFLALESNVLPLYQFLPSNCVIVVDHLMDDGLRFLYNNERQMNRYIRRTYEETRRKKQGVRE